MNFNNHKIKVRNYEKDYLDESKLKLDGNPNFDHISSFNLRNNFERLLIASEIISSKPNRLSMKFETFDHKF